MPRTFAPPSGSVPSGSAPSGPAPSGPASSAPAPSGSAPSGPAASGPAASGPLAPAPMPGDDAFLYRQVERHLLGLMNTGRLGPGDKAPSLRALSRRLGVGLATVNHAYVELEAQGVLEARPRSGFYVRSAPVRPPAPLPRPAAPAPPRPVNRAGLINSSLESLGNRELVSFGVVSPDECLLPLKALTRAMAQALRAHPEQALGYETVPGNLQLRRQIAYRMSELDMPTAPEDLIVTTGALEALFIALRCLTRPGDTVLIAAPGYYCFLQLLETLGLRAVEIGSDPEHGLNPADVADAVDRYRVAAAILNPSYNNPDAALTPDHAKAEIVRILAERGIPLVEDDVSGDLHYGPQRPATCRSFDQSGLVLHCSSFSKTLAPGFRVGWLAPGRFRDKALEIKATTNVSSSSPAQMAVAEYLAAGGFERHLRRLRQAVESQMRALRQHTATRFPKGTRMTDPKGGLMLWVELPGRASGVDLFLRARQAGISIIPGNIFSTQERFDHFIRLSSSSPWTPELLNGLTRLGELAAELV
ncbi:MAG: aminotransferase class I/II-fold pyridoxal phosphate-dependent enzyme [Desulfovibrionaceae bacterium]